MSYKFMSNINNFEEINNPDKAYIQVNKDEEILFKDNNNIDKKALFLMIRAHTSNDLLVEILPYGYGVYVPAGEMWSVDSINEISSIKVKKAFSPSNNSEINSPKIQWMIGYK